MNSAGNISSGFRSDKNPTGVWSGGNPTGERAGNDGVWSGGNSTGGWSGGDTSHDETHLQPVVGTKEFPPLSLKPIALGQTIPSDSSADRYVLEKRTPVPPDQEDFKVQKDLNTLVPESEKMINSGLQQAKHTHAISTELKLLLENEKKILDQVMKRCNKFAQLKEENKQTTEEWHNENQKRLSRYEKYLAKLSNYPDDISIPLDVDGYQGQVQQKILLEIVHKTVEAANDISVQLSIEDTIINDVDVSLTGLKKHSAVILRLISSWMKMLSKHDQQQVEMMERWGRIGQGLKNLKEKAKSPNESANEGSGIASKQFLSFVNEYGNRLRKLEEVYSEQLCKPRIRSAHSKI